MATSSAGPGGTRSALSHSENGDAGNSGGVTTRVIPSPAVVNVRQANAATATKTAIATTPAMTRSRVGGSRDPEPPGYLSHRQIQDVEQRHHGALARRESLQGLEDLAQLGRVLHRVADTDTVAPLAAKLVIGDVER